MKVPPTTHGLQYKHGVVKEKAPGCPLSNLHGYNFWVGVLDNSNPDAGDWKYNDIINAFLFSGEYRGRQW